MNKFYRVATCSSGHVLTHGSICVQQFLDASRLPPPQTWGGKGKGGSPSCLERGASAVSGASDDDFLLNTSKALRRLFRVVSDL